MIDVGAGKYERGDVPRLEVLKALGDNTRYSIYLGLARAVRPLATAEIAELLGLHPNTVRPHLERMRVVGLLQVGMGAARWVGPSTDIRCRRTLPRSGSNRPPCRCSPS